MTPEKSAKWEGPVLLRTARQRMRQLVNDNNVKVQSEVQAMLAALLHEAGWTEKDFLDMVVRDIATNGRERWEVSSPSLAKTLPGSLEGERRPSTHPAPKKSGFQTRASAGSYSHVERSKKTAR